MNFITTTLPYANSIPHVGHALEFVQADFWRRYLDGAYLNIGLDEHGKKIYDTASAQGKDTQEFIDELEIKWKEFCELFNIKYDNFYRTSDKNHHDKVKYIWNKILNSGGIYLKDYKGKYCKGCEEFKTSTQIENDHCVDHPSIDLEDINEQNFFFCLSQYQNGLTTDYVFPVSKRKELENIIFNGQDVSISREHLKWGVSVPDSDQTIYVWFDALLNYIFANPTWEKSFNIQICGPDNLRFQGHLFQGILKALGLKQTDKLLVHGTILDKNGVKMSKTLGNTIDPVEQLNKYGLDALRYYFLKGISTFDNSNWNEDRLVETYNSDIADNYGNLISRIIHLIKLKNIRLNHDEEYASILDSRIANLKSELNSTWDIQNYLTQITELLKEGNKYLNDEEPWKNDKPIVLSNLYYLINNVVELYRPVFGDIKTNKILISIKNKEKDVFFPKIK